MEILGENNQLVIISLFSTAAAFLVHLIGFATPYWYKTPGSHSGLWVGCIEKTSLQCATISGRALTGSLQGAQALECLAFIAFLAAMASAIGRLKFLLNQKKMLLLVSAIANFVAAGFSLVGVIVYSTVKLNSGGGHHFSFAFCIIASLVAIVAGGLAIKRWKQEPTS